jgi:8-amino-7-oxononanoate synthase
MEEKTNELLHLSQWWWLIVVTWAFGPSKRSRHVSHVSQEHFRHSAREPAFRVTDKARLARSLLLLVFNLTPRPSRPLPLLTTTSTTTVAMPSQIEHQLKAQLESRKARSLLRRLVVIPETSADFSSNDFLGLARSPVLNSRFLQELASFPKHAPPLGSTGSRLLDGNSRYAEDLEDMIAHFHHTEAALIFNSGFDANVGFFSSVPQPGDVILYDEYIHASVHDGMKVTRAGVKKAFLHNDLEHLAELLNTVRCEDREKTTAAATTGARSQPKERNIFVAVESVYSMDGDTAPLREIVDLLEPFGAYLIVDEVRS